MKRYRLIVELETEHDVTEEDIEGLQALVSNESGDRGRVVSARLEPLDPDPQPDVTKPSSSPCVRNPSSSSV